MPVHNFLRPGTRAPLRRADMVFQITVIEDREGKYHRRPVGHAGLVAKPMPDHSLGKEVVVYHMGTQVEKHRWADGIPHDAPAAGDPEEIQMIDNRVDVAGTAASIEDASRWTIINQAVSIFQHRPSKLEPKEKNCCYWIGAPIIGTHPLHPNAQNAYAFSCATFVHHCYDQAGKPLVQLTDVPTLKPHERHMFEGWGYFVPPDPVRRLSCSHLICAFEAKPERFPFRPSDGDRESCSDKPTFARLLADAAPPPPPDEAAAPLAGG